MTNRKIIRHVVFFSAKDPNNIEPMMQGLRMLENIPPTRHFEVCRNINEDKYSNEVDVIVYAEFESADDLEAYRCHPLYQECVKVVRPLRDIRVAADF